MAVKDYGRRFYERGMRITRFCRVCYNTHDYQEPSGMYGKPDGTGVAQLSKEELYETKRGFGHEEWLNNKEAKISAIPGFSQGFIQRTNVKNTDRNLYNVALWARVAGNEEEFSGTPDPLNPPPGSCWLVGFITHLSFVGKESLCTRKVTIPFPDDFFDRFEPEKRFCEFTPNVIYPDGCLRILPREKWIMAPRKIPHRYNWPTSSNKDNADLFEWVQEVFDELGPKLNEAASLAENRAEETNGKSNFVSGDEYLEVEPDFDETLEKVNSYCGKDPKTRQVLVSMRTHQADFRQALMLVTGGRCMLTGVDCQRLLVASHIKPFSLCRRSEAYSPENGLLLARNIDALFDSFLISFDAETGDLLKAPGIEDELLAKFGITASETALPNSYLTEGRRKYLKWHNEECVKRSGHN